MYYPKSDRSKPGILSCIDLELFRGIRLKPLAHIELCGTALGRNRDRSKPKFFLPTNEMSTVEYILNKTNSNLLQNPQTQDLKSQDRSSDFSKPF